MYGLKKQQMDPILALKKYVEAAEKFQPEAITQFAITVYMTLMQAYNLPLPTMKLPDKSNVDKFQVEKMWHWLEKAAIMGWISPFLVFQVEQSIRLELFEIPVYVKDAMERRRSGEELDQFLTHFETCPNCDSMNFAPEHLVFCRKCLKEHYCSERCN